MFDDDNTTAGGAYESERQWDLAKYALSFSVGQEASEQQLARLERLYSFDVEGYHFLLPEGQRAELIDHVQFTPMPNAPAHYLGLVNVRGNVLPLYSLAPLICKHAQPPTQSLLYALLIGDSANGALLAVDGKPGSIDKQELQQSTALATSLLELRKCLNGVFIHKGTEWYLLDCDTLFTFLSDPTDR